MDKRLEKLPKDFIERLQSLYPNKFQDICRTFLIERKTTFRINKLKTNMHKLRKDLLDAHIKFREIQDIPGAFALEKTTLRDLQKTDIYNNGEIYVQNLSSMVPVFVMFEDDDIEQNSNVKILDLCAAPGGKTTHIASLTNNEAEILAVEKIRPRYFKLKANLDMQGASESVKAINTNGQAIFKENEEQFDYVLVDAPCSCESGFDANNPRSYAYWSKRKINECRSKQKRLLFAGLKCLKKGGTLVYSTCTMSPEENEFVVNWALKRFADEVVLEDIKFPIKSSIKGITNWKEKDYNPQVTKTKRIIPTDIMESFYVAKFKKV